MLTIIAQFLEVEGLADFAAIATSHVVPRHGRKVWQLADGKTLLDVASVLLQCKPKLRILSADTPEQEHGTGSPHVS